MVSTILSATYVPEDERTDGIDWMLGDTVVLELSCGHTRHGNPSMHHKPGSKFLCRECEKEG